MVSYETHSILIFGNFSKKRYCKGSIKQLVFLFNFVVPITGDSFIKRATQMFEKKNLPLYFHVKLFYLQVYTIPVLQTKQLQSHQRNKVTVLCINNTCSFTIAFL